MSPLDHADYAERRLREDCAKQREAIKALLAALESILETVAYDAMPTWAQTQAARKAVNKAKEIL